MRGCQAFGDTSANARLPHAAGHRAKSMTQAHHDLGLRFLVEPASFELSAEEARQLSVLRPAGIMLRKRNFRQDAGYEEWLGLYAKLVRDVREAIGRERIIVSVDHEGGQVHRFPPPITRFPYPAFYGAEIAAVQAVAAAMGEELRSLGINVSFSPTADIHSNPSNPVINQRAFGTSAGQVSEAAKAFASRLRLAGITPCAKHFPGHGDTSADSHVGLPSVGRTLAELEAREFVPFRALISDGIEMVMSAHIVLAQVAPGVTATLSPEIMTGILRGSLGFAGVTVADALGMAGVAAGGRPEKLAVRAHRAGIDLMLVAGDNVCIADALRLKGTLEQLRDSDPAAERGLQEAEQRVAALLNSLKQYPVSALSEQSLAVHRKLALQLGKNVQWAHFDFNPVGFT